MSHASGADPIADRWPAALGSRVSSVWPWVAVLSTFAASYAAVLRLKPLYAPDTRYYAAMALWFSGDSKEVARAAVAAYPAGAAWETPPVESLFGWGLVQPRVVYPALSVPFVKLWGIDGMAAVPALAMLGFVLVTTWFIRRRFGWAAAIATSLLVVASSFLMFFGTAMLTESLTALWTALMIPAVWRWQRTRDRRMLIALAGLTVLGAFTRQAALIPAGAMVVAWLGSVVLRERNRGWGAPALVVTATAVGSQIGQSLVFPTFSQLTQYYRVTDADNLADAIRATPALAWRILTADMRNYAATDHALLVFVVLSVLAALLLWRRSESHLLIGAFLVVALLNVTNGTPSAFRYAMPGLAFWVLAVAALLAQLASSGRGARTAGRPFAGVPASSSGPDPVAQSSDEVGRTAPES